MLRRISKFTGKNRLREERGGEEERKREREEEWKRSREEGRKRGRD